MTAVLWCFLLCLLLSGGGVSAAPRDTAPGLKIVRATLHSRQEDGPAIADNYEYYSGELLHLSYRIAGYRVQKDKVGLRWQVIAVDPEGRLLVPALSGSIEEDVSDNDRDWLPKVQLSLPLPGQLPPGGYTLKLHAADELGASEVDTEVVFRVGGRPLPQVQGFSVVNLRFFRLETDRVPLEAPVYHPGESLLARFELAGFALGEKNRFDVSYGLSIQDEAGTVLYSRPDAATDSGAPFYPQRLLNGVLSLDLNAEVRPAGYTLVVQASDRVGGGRAELSGKFRVEK